MSTATDQLLFREIEARASRLAEDEFVEFAYAGTPAVGHLCCVACGHGVTCVGLLPPCPDCGSRLWENAATSPFAVSEPVLVPRESYEGWAEEDLDDAGRALRGFWLAVQLGLVVWALLGTILAVMYSMLR
jgi:hypothetical protein